MVSVRRFPVAACIQMAVKMFLNPALSVTDICVLGKPF